MVTATRHSQSRTSQRIVDPVSVYAIKVLRGEIVTGRLVQLACRRHLKDLKRWGTEPSAVHPWFNREAANAAISFFPFLILHDGVNAGTPFQLLLWQKFVVGCLFGWIQADGRRRFRYSLVEVARANGKSPLAAGIGMLGLMGQGKIGREVGAQVYSAATTRDQAKIVFNDAVGMSMAEDSQLAPRLVKTVNNLAYHSNSSFFRPLAAEANKMDGLRVHVALVDELHEHPDGEVLAKLRTGMKSTQPLLFMITTAGFDRHSVCWEEHDYAVKVLEGVVTDDTYFAYIATLDDKDDWTDESVWPKANPSLGVTVRLETLRDECEKAKQIPGQQNSFKRLRLNLWTEASSRWITLETWDRNLSPIRPYSELVRAEAYVGLDLSTTKDLTACEIYFPDEDGLGGDFMHFYFVPEENIDQRSQNDGVPYRQWAQQGFITPTPGNVVDYVAIREVLNQLVEDGFDIKEVAYDPWNATTLISWLIDDGFLCVPVRQGFASLSAPTKEFEKRLIAGRFRGLSNPVARWAASNVTVDMDAAGNVKPSKAKSVERIDPIVAMILAVDRATRQLEENNWSGIFIPEQVDER